MEMLRACLLGGFPWSFLGVSQYQLVPLIQIVAVTGVYGISFLVVWFSLALFCAAKMILQNPAKRHVWQAEIALPLVVVIFCFTGGMFHLNQRTSAEKKLRVAMVQPSIPQTVIWDEAESAKTFQKFLAANDVALTNEIDLLIWPESAVPLMNEENCRAISKFAIKHRTWLIFNGEDLTVTATKKNFFNAAFLVNPQGELATTYHKQKLVIFGEYIPLARWLPFLKWFTPIEDGWTAGNKPVTFELPQAKCAPLICFEDTFATVARSAAQDDIDFLVNLTNDGWFGDSSEQWQHMANAAFRCVENGVPLLRCANNGVTCLIDAHGHVVKIFHDGRGSEYGAGVLQTEIPLLASAAKSAPTFYNRHGDWFGWSCVGIAALLFLKTWRTQLGKKSDSFETSTDGFKTD
jgi:apolipoprotein N-acyltransferase